jgi:hypothetical protein
MINRQKVPMMVPGLGAPWQISADQQHSGSILLGGLP